MRISARHKALDLCVIIRFVTLHSFFRDKHGKLAIWQTPNLPIVIWFVFLLAGKATSGNMHVFCSVVSTVSLIVWAILEITSGASYFRRLLGLVVVAVTILSRIMS